MPVTYSKSVFQAQRLNLLVVSYILEHENLQCHLLKLDVT